MAKWDEKYIVTELKQKIVEATWTPSFSDNEGRRLGVDRRQFSYDIHIPEHRADKDRRSGLDRRLKPRTSK